MKKIVLSFFFLTVVSSRSFSQSDCGSNAGFESGTTAGWVCKWGTYGALPGICPVPSAGYCPTFPTTLDSIGCINLSGNDALGIGFNDRHTIMTKNYRPWAGTGKGMDSISGNTVPVVNPNGGNYSFRLGDEKTGGVGTNPNRFARAEAIVVKFNVKPTDPFFIFSYAVFLQDPGHLPEEQPRFEVLFKDSIDSILPGGYFKFIAGSSNPYCIGSRDSGTYKFGAGQLSQWRYTEWTDTFFDLNAYKLQNISVEFRTSDCFPSQYTIPTCTIPCCHAPGTHSAYAYIEASCSPTSIGIKKIKDQIGFHIYPNPLTSSSTLQLTTPLKDAEVIIYDMLGEEMMRKSFSGDRMKIERGNLTSGVYFVKVRDFGSAQSANNGSAHSAEFVQKLMVE